jgi:hypothetical protein
MNGQLYRTDSSLGTVLIRISLLRKSSLLNGHSVERTRTAIFPPSLKIKLPWADAAPVNRRQPELVASFYMHQNFLSDSY